MLVILGDCRNPGQSHVTIPTGIATVGNPSGIAKPVAIPSGIAAGIVKITFGIVMHNPTSYNYKISTDCWSESVC